MKHLLPALALLLALCHPERVSAQDTKGVRPVPPTAPGAAPAAVRAVVVGISDYQDKNIPDLQFADRDARAFDDWLRSPAGGNVPEANITLLTNANATFAKLGIHLQALMEDCAPNERAIIYFSGHGDVETNTAFQPGYLLCWDSPAQNYMAGAFPLFHLQNVVATLAAKNVKVTLVTDACHSGKLAGSDINGAQLTGQNLAKQFANETKILSCQPNEFSIEGDQWGGGRGVFSYFLLKGLTGLADKNGDGTVSLKEIDTYLGEVVQPEIEPQVQTPFTVGDRNAAINLVDARSLDSLVILEKTQMTSLRKIAQKGLEDDVLAKADSTTRKLYGAFKEALAAHNLLEPAGNNAWELFQKSVANEQLEPLHRLMRRNLAAALIDEVQQALNALLDADPYMYNKWYYEPSRFRQYPEYLQRAIELLGKDHNMYRSLMSKKLYFEALNVTKSITDAGQSTDMRDSLKALAKQKLLEGIAYEDKAAYLYHAIGNLYSRSNDQQGFDSLLLYSSKALEYSPHWLLPYLDISYEYQLSLNDVFKTEEWLIKALKINPESYIVLERLSWLRQWQNRTDESLEISRKMIALKPDLFNAYGTAAVTCLMRKEFERAESYFSQMQALNPTSNNEFIQYWINLLFRTRRIKAGIALTEKVIQNDSTGFVYKSYAAFEAALESYYTRQFALAEKYASQIIAMNEVPAMAGFAFMVKGWLAYERGNIGAARKFLQQAVEIYPRGPEILIGSDKMEAHIAEQEGNLVKADSLFRQAMTLPPEFPAHDIRNYLWLEIPSFEYGWFLLRHHRPEEARQQFQRLVDAEPLGYHGFYGMALWAAAKGRQTEALDDLEKALDRWYPVPGPIYEELLFAKLRQTKRFKTLMAKHFPPGWEEQ